MSSPARRRRPASKRRAGSRPRPRTSGKRRQQDNDHLAAVVVAGLVSVGLVVPAVNWLLANWWILVVLGLAAAGAGGCWLYQRQQRARWDAVRAQALRYAMPQLDALHHSRFEDAVRDLMFRDGCRDAVRVGGGGDQGADVKATDPYGRRWVIQCKHRRDGLAGSAVGAPDLQVLNGTARPVHHADVAVIVTNGRVTAPAVTFARQQRLHVVDRHTLAAWAAGSRPLWDLLPAVPRPRRPGTLS